MTDTPSTRLLRAILTEPQPCEHIEALVEFMAKRPVVIHGVTLPQIECQACDIEMHYVTFTGLLMGAMAERN